AGLRSRLLRWGSRLARCDRDVWLIGTAPVQHHDDPANSSQQDNGRGHDGDDHHRAFLGWRTLGAGRLRPWSLRPKTRRLRRKFARRGAVRPLRAVAALWRIALLGWLLGRISARLLRRISRARLLRRISRARLLRRIATRTLRRVAALLTPVW